MKFKTGDRVIFVRNPRAYEIGRDNPIQHSKWFCEGTVENQLHESDYVYVNWDNGTTNDYLPECLELVKPKVYLPEELFAV